MRLKRFLEMRGADAGTPAMMVAQSALWVGLLYDDAALAAADALVRSYPTERSPRCGRWCRRRPWRRPGAAGTLRDLAREVLAIAADGLRARAGSIEGADETALSRPAARDRGGGPTQAEHWLVRYANDWDGDVTRIFDEAAI